MPTDIKTRRNVLFVDDDASFLEMMERVMGLWGKDQWQIYLAENTGKALAIIQDHSIHLVAIDVQMPVVDGLQFLTLLNRKYPNLQKVVLTGYANETYRAACLNNGAELFLEKPRTIEGMESVFATLNELAKWQPEEGFHGVLRRVGLPDVIQMECLSRNSSVLEVSGQNIVGEISIENGEIIHAQAGRRSGEPAFNYLLTLSGGEFRLKPFSAPAERTILGAWESLLMEAARLRDEEGEAPDVEAPPDTTTREASPQPGASINLPEGSGEAPRRIPLSASEPAAQANATETSFFRSLARQPESQNFSPVELIRNTLRVPVVAPIDDEKEIFPSRIDEFLICSAKGDVLYQWQCNDSDVRISFLEFLSQKSRQIGQGLALGTFDRLEIQGPKSRMVAQIDANRGLLVRTSKASLEIASAVGF